VLFGSIHEMIPQSSRSAQLTGHVFGFEGEDQEFDQLMKALSP